MLKLRPKLFDESAKSHASKSLIIQIAVFIAVFLVIYVLEGIVAAIVSSKPMDEALAAKGYLDGTKDLTFSESMDIAEEVSAKPGVMIPTLFATVFGTIVSMLYCRYFEMRRVSSMGVVKRRAGVNYVSGLFIGALLMTSITMLTVVTGANSLSRAHDVDYTLILLYLGGFLVQGMSEEFIFRGYLMTTVGGTHSTYLAIGISAVLFGAAHSANAGLSVLAMFNLILFGVFAAVYMIYFEDIWGVCGIHSIWNFSQGNLYGISVSGNSQTESILKTSSKTSHDFLTGGKFGIEGSVFTTLVLLAATGIMLYLQWQKEKKAAAESAPENK